MTFLTYRRGQESIRLSVPRDPWLLVDHVRGKFYPDVVPSKNEPAYLRALKIQKVEK